MDALEVSKVDLLKRDAEDAYLNSLWNNRFRYLSSARGSRLVDDKRKTVLERFEGYQLIQNDLATRPSSDSLVKGGRKEPIEASIIPAVYGEDAAMHSVLERQRQQRNKIPKWHAPWALKRIVNGHKGWVRCIVVNRVENDWFATGSNDTQIKVWDMASGRLKLTLAGHTMTVRGLAISESHPYMFSASEDKLVKCWDLEKNTSIRDFHGHFSGVNTVDVHPTLDVIASAGRDAVVKLWDIRTRAPILTLAGHKGPINKVKCFPVDPQVVSSSTDGSVRMWDLRAGKASKILTHHSKSVRDIAAHPREYSMATASTSDVRSWRIRDGQLLTNFDSGPVGIITCLGINDDNILFAGSESGKLTFFDYETGHRYQELETELAEGSLESERSILCGAFDLTGLRLITGESDKSIKIWKQVEDATPETHPNLLWDPNLPMQRF
ncbi:LAMI_0F04456g1_1 [Lachancea mirantina]|uniref:Pre-mRNA-splicing factor PRP46 n=1 Tax=Lachancea mirantina TaxID=1230905 RepID=A0A1G4JXR2_9SACH|nr:LAMI_0F04456g1_1 [Lachancea mirantina]